MLAGKHGSKQKADHGRHYHQQVILHGSDMDTTVKLLNNSESIHQRGIFSFLISVVIHASHVIVLLLATTSKLFLLTVHSGGHNEFMTQVCRYMCPLLRLDRGSPPAIVGRRGLQVTTPQTQECHLK